MCYYFHTQGCSCRKHIEEKGCSYEHYQIPMKKTDQNHIKIMQLTFEILYGLKS